MTPRVRINSVFRVVEGADFLELNTKNGYYYVRKYRAGKGELFKSTRSKKKGEAKTIAENMIADWLGIRGHTRKRVRLGPIADEFLEWCKSQHETMGLDGRPLRRKATYKHDLSHVKFIKLHFGENYLDEIDEQFWDDWVQNTGRGLGRTLGDASKYLSLIVGFAFKRKIVARKPSFASPDKGTNNAVVYENSQIRLFLKHSGPRLHSMIILASENPLRPHEVREMRWDFLTFESDGTAVLRLPAWFSKTRKDRELELSPTSSKILKQLRRAGKGHSAFVFPSPRAPEKPISDAILSRDFREMLKRAGISKRLLFHWLRHSVYSKLLLDAKLPVQHVSEAGGTSIAVLQRRYLKSNHKRTREVGRAINLSLSEEE